jgi:hypothetical protein
MANAVLFKQQFGFEIVDPQADASHAVPPQGIEVCVGPAITGAFKNCLDPRGSVRIFFRGLRASPGKQWLAPIHGVGRLWKPQLVRVQLLCFHRCALPRIEGYRRWRSTT